MTYLSPDDGVRNQQFSVLSDPIQQIQSEVFIWGDFNDLLDPGEKRGGNIRERWRCAQFQGFVDSCGVEDLGYIGYPFTWRNNRMGVDFIESRLDRVLISSSLSSKYPAASVEHLDCLGSDHKALLLCTQGQVRRGFTPFRIDARWLEMEEVREIIQTQWGEGVTGSRLFNLCHKLKKCRRALLSWRKTRNLNSRRNLEDYQAKLKELEGAGRENHGEEIAAIEDRIAHEWSQEEMYWRQKSHLKWLQLGDRNTSFFHASTRVRRARNRISGVENANGRWVTDSAGIMAEFQGFFSSLYRSEATPQIQQVCDIIPQRVSRATNSGLVKAFSSNEIKAAVFDMHPNKAPGYDGYTAGFFQRYWDIVGEDVCRAVRSFFYSGRMLGSINRTQIVLILKVAAPTKVQEYRPISLCTTMYKVIAKLLARWLKRFLPNIISMNQSAFIEGRQISDNVLIAHEILHYIRHKKSGNKGVAAFKLDMAKAYDRVEWGYLEAVLTRLGFHSQWISWVMACVKTVSFSITVNGAAGETFLPSRGIRQGCPLSPYLFLLCGEGLSALLEESIRRKQLVSFRINFHCPKVSHLLFADDLVVYCQATEHDCEGLRSILEVYELASGQQVNKRKSSVIFSPNTPPVFREQLASLVGIPPESCHSKYLGLPLFLGHSKRELFAYIKDRVIQRLRSWDGVTPNGAGREFLIKSVVLPIASYAMSCFRLPKNLMDQISSEVARFWWGSRNGERKIAWVRWDKLKDCKGEGGMGFRDMVSFNRALLAKQGWKLVSGAPSLFRQIFKGRYFPRTTFWNAPVSSQSSWAWRSIAWARTLIEKGWRWQIFSGSDARIWEDPLLPSSPTLRISPASARREGLSMVSDLIDSVSKTWKEGLVREVFAAVDADYILRIPLSTTQSRDRRVWHFSPSGKFTVKSAYSLENKSSRSYSDVQAGQSSGASELALVWKRLWSLCIHPKVKVFGWKCFHDALATNLGLTVRKIKEDPTCSLCGREEESICHLLFRCDHACKIWTLSPLRLRPEVLLQFRGILDWWIFIRERMDHGSLPPNALALGLSYCWWIWRTRNEAIFNNVLWPIEAVHSKALSYFYEFSQANVRSHSDSTQEDQARIDAWIRPEGCDVKINVDAGISKEHQRCGIGAIARDCSGQVIGIALNIFSGITCPRIAESLAIREGLYLGSRLSLPRVIVESDAKDVVQACTTTNDIPSDIGAIICDCMHLKNSFEFCDFKFVKRHCNRAAYDCAIKARSCGVSSLWTPPLPPWGSLLSDV